MLLLLTSTPNIEQHEEDVYYVRVFSKGDTVASTYAAAVAALVNGE
jgi:hypothetical protein